jgi:hypothetical protein
MYKGELIPENGEWTVDKDEDYPEYVHLSVNEITEDGVFAHDFYFPPKNAKELAKALKNHALVIEGTTD